MSRFAEMMTRAALPAAGFGVNGSPNGRRKMITPRLGNLKANPNSTGGRRGIKAATQDITFTSPGAPLPIDWNTQEQAKLAYMGQVYVQRGCRLIADTIAQLPWVAGPDPTDPAVYDKNASLAVLLGPATPQAPGGPNAKTSARVFWSWTIIQYLVTGRWGWEVEYLPGTKEIVGLWPLVSACLAPKPATGPNWFNGFEYTPAQGQIELANDKVIYCWKPSIVDFRQAESPLVSAQYPVYIANSINRYMANLLQKDMVATTLIATPPMDEPEMRRAWQDQFLSKFTGVGNAGRAIFAEIEPGDNDSSSKPLIQIEKLATTPIEGGLMDLLAVAKSDICIALGVPKSLMGEATDATFSNSAQEWQNFWTTTLLNVIMELQDHINLNLAPRLDGGMNVGWFDLSNVEALQPSSIIAPPDLMSLVQTGVASPSQVAQILGIPAQPGSVDPRDVNTNTLINEAGQQAGAGAASINWNEVLTRAAIYQRNEWQQQRHNTWTLRGLRKEPEPEREHIIIDTRATTKPRNPAFERRTAAILARTSELAAGTTPLDSLDKQELVQLDGLGEALAS